MWVLYQHHTVCQQIRWYQLLHTNRFNDALDRKFRKFMHKLLSNDNDILVLKLWLQHQVIFVENKFCGLLKMQCHHILLVRIAKESITCWKVSKFDYLYNFIPWKRTLMKFSANYYKISIYWVVQFYYKYFCKIDCHLLPITFEKGISSTGTQCRFVWMCNEEQDGQNWWKSQHEHWLCPNHIEPTNWSRPRYK